MIGRLRFFTQHIMFLVLTYGGRTGIHFGHSLPCFSCPYVAGCSGHCYLMALQSNYGIAFYLPDIMSSTGFKVLLYLLVFVVLVIILSKTWCGWICPFGTLQDWLSFLRKKLGIRESRFSWKTRNRLRPVKYILLAYLLIVPLFITYGGLHSDFSIPFCKICPAKPIMPLFVGETRNLSIDYANTVTMVFSILSLTIAAGVLVGAFFKERFFCIFCPMLPLIQIFKKVSFLRFEKNVHYCSGCGNCQRMCPVDIRGVSDEKEKKEVMDEDCMLCLKCIESCPEDKSLNIKLFNFNIFSSSRNYVARNCRRGK